MVINNYKSMYYRFFKIWSHHQVAQAGLEKHSLLMMKTS